MLLPLARMMWSSVTPVVEIVKETGTYFINPVRQELKKSRLYIQLTSNIKQSSVFNFDISSNIKTKGLIKIKTLSNIKNKKRIKYNIFSNIKNKIITKWNLISNIKNSSLFKSRIITKGHDEYIKDFDEFIRFTNW